MLALWELATACRAQQHYTEAEKHFRRAIETLEHTEQAEVRFLAGAFRGDLAEMYQAQGEPAKLFLAAASTKRNRSQGTGPTATESR